MKDKLNIMKRQNIYKMSNKIILLKNKKNKEVKLLKTMIIIIIIMINKYPKT